MNLSSQPDPFATERQRMVEHDLRGRAIQDNRVLASMLRVPRHEFVPERYRDRAYEDHPLPIGEGQTISQPYIVALMLEALELQPNDKVLEIGTGSGYLTALLAELAGQVFSMERHEQLAAEARDTLARLGYTNVRVLTGDGSRGFPDCAPYDAIIVSAAALEVPQPLFSQMRDGGRMIIPVGSSESQQLQLVRKEAGRPMITTREACRFVPLISGAELGK